MGAEPYQYVVDYDADIQAALVKLRADVFRRGDYHGADRHPNSAEAALELAGADGTRSILDIQRITPDPDYCCAAPFTPDELERYFGTDKPTTDLVEACEELWEDLERGMARYIIAYENGVPRSIVFVGYSFD